MGQSGSGTEGGGFFENLFYGTGNLITDGGKGIVGGFKDAIGTVTGSKQANEMMKRSEARVAEEQAQREKTMQDERFRRQQEDIGASQSAALIQNRGRARLGKASFEPLGDSNSGNYLGL